MDVHVTPDEYNRLTLAIDQTSRTAIFNPINNPEIDIRPIVAQVLGADVADRIQYGTARLVVHWHGEITERITS